MTIVTESKQLNFFLYPSCQGRAPQVVKWSVLWERAVLYLLSTRYFALQCLTKIALHSYHDLSYMKVKGDQHPVMEVTPNKHWLQTQ